MIYQTSLGLGFGWFFGIVIAIALISFLVYYKSMVVVPFNEIHVLSKNKRVTTFDGKGRYAYFKFLHARTIIPKHVLDIEPRLLDLHDRDNLPFGVEISIKVQVSDPEKAAATLTQIDHSTVAKVVEDTVMSAARSLAMERTILEIMKEREEIENDIYRMVSDSLAKLGLSAIIFDIKNIRDMEDTDVIGQFERIKIAEIRKNARISEAIQNNEALEVELEREKRSKVKIELMKGEEEDARLRREQELVQKEKLVEMEKLNVEEQKRVRIAKMERDTKMIEAQSAAEALALKAKSEADAISLKYKAEADGIRERGYAEADILVKKAEAMKDGNFAGQIKLLEILASAQVQSAEKIADSLGKNNKIMYLPSDGNNNVMSSFMPKLDSILQSGIADDILEKIKPKKKSTKKTKA